MPVCSELWRSLTQNTPTLQAKSKWLPSAKTMIIIITSTKSKHLYSRTTWDPYYMKNIAVEKTTNKNTPFRTVADNQMISVTRMLQSIKWCALETMTKGTKLMTISTRFATITRTGNWKNTLSQTQNKETEAAIINFTFQIHEASKNTSKFSFS